MKLGYFYGRTGRQIANQNIVYTPEYTMFVSYNTNIVKTTFDDEGKRITILDSYYWDYSRTTGKYRNEFLGEGIEETRKKIEDGKYILGNLN